jgi:hypothetical protein
MSRAVVASTLAISALVGSLFPATAQTLQRLPSVVRHASVATPAPVATPLPVGPLHSAAGTIESIATGSVLLVMLRDRRPLRVDASWAVAHGFYSAPLFVGKVVIIQGRFGADGTFYATTLTRLTKLDASLPQDR